MVQRQVFLKGWGGRVLVLFLLNFFKVYHFLHLEVTLPIAKLCYAFEEKKNFSNHNFKKKGHSNLSKNEPENIPEIKITYL